MSEVITEKKPVDKVVAPEADDLKARLQKLIQDRESKNPAAEVKGAKKTFWEVTPDDFLEMPDMPKIKVKPKEEKNPVDEKKDSDQEDPDEEKTTGKKGKLTHDLKNSAANTAVGMTQLTIRMILTPIINYKFKKKFTDDEIEKIDDIVDKEDAALDEKEMVIKKKWNRLMKKRDAKIKGIEFDPQKEADLHKAFYNYFEVTESTMSPGWYLAFAMINVIGGSIVDVLTD